MSKQARDLPLDLIISEYQSGMSTNALEKKYGVSDTTIRNRLVKAGVQIRKKGGFVRGGGRGIPTED